MTKLCSACDKVLEATLFSKYARSKDGLKPHCKKCAKLSHAKYYELNKDKITNTIIDWQAKNQDKVRAYKKKHYSNNSGAECNIE